MDMQDDWLHGLRSWASANGSVRELWLFGSRAQGCARPDSDVDLALALMPPKGNTDWSLGAYYADAERKWKPQLEEIVGRDVDLEVIVPDPPGQTDYDSMVRCFGIRLWSRDDASFNSMPLLILKCASASRSSGEWRDDDFDVLEDGVVIGRIFLSPAAPQDRQWMWTLAYGQHEDRTPTHGYESRREAAMAAFAKSWRRS
jgi:predicted nucleotidyltransferase